MILSKSQLQTIALGFGVFLLMGLYMLMFLTAAFPYNADEHRKAEIAKERAEQRARAIKDMQEHR
jgi:hypothetical protein